MAIDASGNVGIGTASPNFPLNVHITASNVTLASFHGTGNSALSTPIGITFGTRTDAGSGTGDQRAGVFYEYNGNLFLAGKSGVGDLATSPKQYSQLYIDGANDRVGIGNTAPTYTLDVTGDLLVTKTSGNLARFTGAGSTSFYISATGQITHTSTTGNTAFAINQSGAGPTLNVDSGLLYASASVVGIGTTSPACLVYTSEAADE